VCFVHTVMYPVHQFKSATVVADTLLGAPPLDATYKYIWCII